MTRWECFVSKTCFLRAVSIILTDGMTGSVSTECE